MSKTFYKTLYSQPQWPERYIPGTITKRILLVSHNLSQSGAPLTLAELAKYLVRTGYEVALYSPKDGPTRKIFESYNIPVIIESTQVNPSSNVIDIVRQILCSDLVIANTIISYRAIFAAKAFDRLVIGWVHESKSGVDYCTQFPEMGRALALANALVFPTYATSELYQQFVDTTQVNVIPVGQGPIRKNLL